MSNALQKQNKVISTMLMYHITRGTLANMGSMNKADQSIISRIVFTKLINRMNKEGK